MISKTSNAGRPTTATRPVELSASVSGVPHSASGTMLINSASPWRAHRAEEQIMATSVDLGSALDLAYRIQARPPLDIAYGCDP